MIDFHASEPHYFAHLAPIYEAVPYYHRGTFRVALGMEDFARHHGVEPSIAEQGDVVVVAGWRDARQGHHRKVVLAEHGIGQTYSNSNPHYAGGVGRDHVALFLAPNYRVMRLNQRANPKAMHAMVGTPKMDRWFSGDEVLAAEPSFPAIAFHWDSDVCNETTSGFRYFRDAVAELNDERMIAAHHHPRAPEIGRWMRARGVTVLDELDNVMAFASVLAFDNTSAGYEFAALGKPVVVLNPPQYRRDVEHGLRFWEFADVGINCYSPEALPWAIDTALADEDDQADRRAEISAELFPIQDGTSTRWAVDAIRSLT